MIYVRIVKLPKPRYHCLIKSTEGKNLGIEPSMTEAIHKVEQEGWAFAPTPEEIPKPSTSMLKQWRWINES